MEEWGRAWGWYPAPAQFRPINCACLARLSRGCGLQEGVN